MAKKELDPNVYLDAAVLVVDGDEQFSCYAVDIAAGRDPYNESSSPEGAAYYNMFAPHYTNYGPGPVDYAYWNRPKNEKNQLMRSIALLFMAEMVNDGAI